MKPVSEVKLMDCMDYMRGFPDKFFELAVVDPEFGIGAAKNKGKSIGLRKKWKGYGTAKYTEKNWDDTPAGGAYFSELFRVSKNWIVWGANYFDIPTSKGIMAWDKGCDGTSFSDFELAYSSFEKSAKIFRYPIQGESQQRIHPTQKPIALYEWLLKNYAKPGDKILDTHLGSQSSRIAAYKLGFDFYGTEIDADYFNEGCARFEISIAMPLFDSIEIPEQLKMF